MSNADAEIQFFYYNPDSPQNNLTVLKRDMDTALVSSPQPIHFQAFSRLHDFDKKIKEAKPNFLYVPYWYLETYGKQLNIQPLLYSVRNNKHTYQKKIIILKSSQLKIKNLLQKTLATTTMGPNSESILDALLFKEHKIKASKIHRVDVPKDSDAIFAVALGQVDSALVSTESLKSISLINPQLTLHVKSIAITKNINLPVLCYIKGSISKANIKKLKQYFLKPRSASILDVLQIDAWRENDE